MVVLSADLLGCVPRIRSVFSERREDQARRVRYGWRGRSAQPARPPTGFVLSVHSAWDARHRSITHHGGLAPVAFPRDTLLGRRGILAHPRNAAVLAAPPLLHAWAHTSSEHAGRGGGAAGVCGHGAAGGLGAAVQQSALLRAGVGGGGVGVDPEAVATGVLPRGKSWAGSGVGPIGP
eukprot:ctg_838.g348